MRDPTIFPIIQTPIQKAANGYINGNGFMGNGCGWSWNNVVDNLTLCLRNNPDHIFVYTPTLTLSSHLIAYISIWIWPMHFVTGEISWVQIKMGTVLLGYAHQSIPLCASYLWQAQEWWRLVMHTIHTSIARFAFHDIKKLVILTPWVPGTRAKCRPFCPSYCTL